MTVLISFATPEEVPELDGALAVGGSAPVLIGGVMMYVTGQATLDSDYVNDTLQEPGGQDRVKTVAMHELGHVIGLAHAPERGEVMNHPIKSEPVPVTAEGSRSWDRARVTKASGWDTSAASAGLGGTQAPSRLSRQRPATTA